MIVVVMGVSGSVKEFVSDGNRLRKLRLEEVRRHGHVLTPGHSIGAEAQEDDDEPFEDKMQRLARDPAAIVDPC